MNILIIGRKFEAISDVKTYTEMWAYNLACAFSEAGITLQYHRPYSLASKARRIMLKLC